MSTDDFSVKIIACAICGNEITKCTCNKFVCPIHGIVKAILTGKTKKTVNKNKRDTHVEVDHYQCSIDNCTIKRTLDQMEYPYTGADESE